jgi:cytochrome c-type biogenesis protein CcmH
MQASPPDIFALILFVLAIVVLAAGSGLWLMRAAVRAAEPDNSTELAIYRDQIGEVERDLAEGRLSETAAAAALLEVGRRLARAEERVAAAQPAKSGMSRVLILISAAFVAFGAGGLYLWRGSLMDDQPFAERKAAILQQSPETLGDDEVIVLLQEQAKATPEDPRPHLLLGQVLASQGRDNEALRAFQAAMRRDGRNADALAELGALFLRTSENGESPEADEAFAAALSIDPNHVPTRHFQATALWQRGNRDGAWAAWRATWSALAGNQAAQLDLSGRIFDVVSALDAGPDGDMAQGMAALAPEQRMAAVQSMIDRRRARVTASPNDLALRLSVVRVLVMSGDGAAARDVLQQGFDGVGGDQFAASLLATAGALTGLGVPDPATGRLSSPQ